MAQLARIFTGMDNGPETIDKNFQQLLGAVTTSPTVDSNAGLVFQNGFGDYSSARSEYSYIQLDGCKIVFLRIGVTLSANPSSKNEVIAVTLPESISFDGWTEFLENDKYRWSFNGTQARISVVGSSDWWAGAGSHYLASITYIHKD